MGHSGTVIIPMEQPAVMLISHMCLSRKPVQAEVVAEVVLVIVAVAVVIRALHHQAS
jgi:hypothetical protein